MEEGLSQWIKKELLADPTAELERNKEQIKKHIRLTPNGKVVVEAGKLTSRLQVGFYYIGAAYAKVAQLREEDTVTNKELHEMLNIPEGTIHPKVKELRDQHFIICVRDGVHRIDYRKIEELLKETEKSMTSEKLNV